MKIILRNYIILCFTSSKKESKFVLSGKPDSKDNQRGTPAMSDLHDTIYTLFKNHPAANVLDAIADALDYASDRAAKSPHRETKRLRAVYHKLAGMVSAAQTYAVKEGTP